MANFDPVSYMMGQKAAGGGGSSDRVILIAENGTLPMTYSAILALYTQGKDIIVVDTFSDSVGELWELHTTAQFPLLSMTYQPNAETPEVGGSVYAVNTTGPYFGVYGTPTIDGYPSRNDD